MQILNPCIKSVIAIKILNHKEKNNKNPQKATTQKPKETWSARKLHFFCLEIETDYCLECKKDTEVVQAYQVIESAMSVAWFLKVATSMNMLNEEHPPMITI